MASIGAGPAPVVTSAIRVSSLAETPIGVMDSPGVPLSTDAEVEAALRGFYWVFLRARPEVAAFWAAALLAGIVGMGLHAHALRRLKVTDATPMDLAEARRPS